MPHSFAGSRSSRNIPKCSAPKFELHICTNKTCKKQGSIEVLRFAQDLGVAELRVESTGCLGGCGSGPNMILQPGEVPLRHVSTPARMAEVLRTFCDLDIPDVLLKATELRLAGNAEARGGDLRRAVELYTQGIELRPPSGLHMLLSNRSGALLTLGDKSGALADANSAAMLAPPGFHTAYVRQVEACAALGRYREAAEALAAAAERDPSFAKTQEYKSLSTQLTAYFQGVRK
ncbi:probable protein STIP1 homolog at C-terminar half [Coccomyxa sp. Obi]|nr:probable protein STIP1 homolog at C-terminar half [Coccomyxa sp. Obi]